jgi:hypothetical protein
MFRCLRYQMIISDVWRVRSWRKLRSTYSGESCVRFDTCSSRWRIFGMRRQIIFVLYGRGAACCVRRISGFFSYWPTDFCILTPEPSIVVYTYSDLSECTQLLIGLVCRISSQLRDHRSYLLRVF